MTEGEVVEQLVEFTDILLLGVSVFFTVVSAYIAALNYFIASAGFLARLFAFGFVSLVLALLMGILFGSRMTHNGLTARLEEIKAEGGLSAAGDAVLGNARDTFLLFGRYEMTTDQAVLLGVCVSAGVVYLSLIYLTFIYRWRPDFPGHIAGDASVRMP